MKALFTFRIIRKGGKWRVETWDAEPPYGPAWQPAYSGAVTVEEARLFFDTATVLEWHDQAHMSGRYTFA